MLAEIETEERELWWSAPTIVVDHREQASGIPELLIEQREAEVRVEELKVGDYLIDGRVVVERKTLDDFAASVVDGRLFRQAARLNKSPWRPAILLEGWKLHRTMSRNALNGALVSLALIFDIPVFRSQDVAEREGFELLRAAAVPSVNAPLRRSH